MSSNETALFIFFTIVIAAFVFKTLTGFKNVRSLFLSKTKQKELDEFFSKYFHYYNQLSNKHKSKFVFRANDLSRNIRIVGKHNFEITEEVRLFVVAAQVQLTFGFRNYALPMFRTIIIYPDSFRNPITGNMHDGEVNPRGVIVLSWKKLVKGHVIPDDKINLGLHELAHALMHTIKHSQNHELGLDLFLDKVIKLSKEEIKKIKSSDYHFFREYAGTNIYEFFAVAIECFFEVSNDFKKELPILYGYISKLIKQNPADKIFCM
jgi:Mlc titration factor MtfA (ptsG expression regulator)